MSRIQDPEVRVLATLSQMLESDYAGEDEEWIGSPFAWIKTRPSRQVGKIGEQLVAGWLAARGFNVGRSPDSEADRVVEGLRVEIKFSTLWRNGSYKFQQLRDQNYDFAICLGVSPFDAHCWVLPKEEVLQRWSEGAPGIAAQHGGARGTDTAWLSVPPTAVPSWLQDQGGRLRSGLLRIAAITGFEPSPLNAEDDTS